MSTLNTKFVNTKLTAQIVEAKQLRNVLSNSLPCYNKCRMCDGNDDLEHVHYKNEIKKSYVCSTCVKIVKHQNLETLTRNENEFCKVCDQNDRTLFIQVVTNNLCIEYFEKINNKEFFII